MKKPSTILGTSQDTDLNLNTLSGPSQDRKSTSGASNGVETRGDIDSSGLDESEGENFDQKAWEAKFRCLNLKTSSKRISNGEDLGKYSSIRNNNFKSFFFNLVFQSNSEGFTSIDSSAPETNSSDNSPTVSRRNLRIATSKANADSESDSERDSTQRSGMFLFAGILFTRAFRK